MTIMLRNLLTGETVQVHSVFDHPDTTVDKPILADDNGKVYGAVAATPPEGYAFVPFVGGGYL